MSKSARSAAAGILALCMFPVSAPAAELLFHQGFESCWSPALSKAQFLQALRSSIDGTSACLPPQTGTVSGIGYTICSNANGCGPGVAGCHVAVQSAAFTGNFQDGAFSAPGTASSIAVPITTSVLGACTLNLDNIVLGYALDYLMQVDGLDGVYSADMLLPLVDVVSYAASNDCNPVLQSFISTYTPQALAQAESAAAAAIEPGLRADTLGQSICPLAE